MRAAGCPYFEKGEGEERVDLAEVMDRDPRALTDVIGGRARLKAGLPRLGRADAKCATFTTRAGKDAGAVVPQIVRVDGATPFDGRPEPVTGTAEFRPVRFDGMADAMALAEAEAEDGVWENWRQGHRRYGRRPGDFGMQVDRIWERFGVMEDFEGVDVT